MFNFHVHIYSFFLSRSSSPNVNVLRATDGSVSKCARCPAGYMTNTLAAVNASRCTSCPTGLYTPTSVAACKACPVGHSGVHGKVALQQHVTCRKVDARMKLLLTSEITTMDPSITYVHLHQPSER